MDNEILIREIENAVAAYDYDLATTKINELGSDVLNLKPKVEDLKICYSKISIVGGLKQDDFVTDVEYDAICKRITQHLSKEQTDFIKCLNNLAN